MLTNQHLLNLETFWAKKYKQLIFNNVHFKESKKPLFSSGFLLFTFYFFGKNTSANMQRALPPPHTSMVERSV